MCLIFWLSNGLVNGSHAIKLVFITHLALARLSFTYSFIFFQQILFESLCMLYSMFGEKDEKYGSFPQGAQSKRAFNEC